MDNQIETIQRMAKDMRLSALKMAFAAGANGAHVGPGFSAIEIIATLYGGVMKLDASDPTWEGRDRFIISKAHAVLAYYNALSQVGYIPAADLSTFESNDGYLPGHPVMNPGKGIEFSGGSLGMGLGLGIGVALAAKKRKAGFSAYVLLGDGECNEGSVWEAAMSAAHFQLDNLIAIVDCNKLQYDGTTREILDMGDMRKKWESFGWASVDVDGHSVPALYEALKSRPAASKPYAVIAHTIKGKGVSFMENNKEWHHARITKEQYEKALEELTRS